MNQQNGTPQAPQIVRRPPSTSGSFFILLIILFMIFNGDSELLGQTDRRDTLQELKYEYSNYTAWMEGRSSNFTVQREIQDILNLREAFLHTPAIPPTTTVGYYTNITGNYNSKTVYFHNITHPPSEVGWGPLANALYNGKNLTSVRNRAEGWNWTQKMHLSFSMYSYRSSFLSKNATLFNRFRGFIELEAPDLQSGMLDTPLLSLRVEGIHLPHNGSLIGLVERKSVMPDIRQLPALVPPGFENSTVKVIADQLSERIEDFEQSVRMGTMENQSDDSSETSCSFTFHGQLDPLYVSQHLIEAYQNEMDDPSGIPLVSLPKPRFTGVLMSEECGVLLELDDIKGQSASRLKQRIITFSAISSLVFYLLIQFSLQVSDEWRTATGLLRGSRGVMATWLIADSYAAISHIMAAVMTTEVRYAILIPGFLGCVLFVTDLRLLTYLNGVQMMLNQAAATNATPPAPTTVPADTPVTVPAPTSIEPETTAAATQPPPVSSRTTRPVPIIAQPITPQSVSRLFISTVKWLFGNDFRAWVTTVIVLCIFCMIFFGLPIYGAWFVMVSSTWSAQVLRNVYQRTRRVIRHDTLVFSSIVRLFIPLYLFACPNNLLNIDPTPWIWIVPTWVIVQAAVLLGQDYFGPTWFIPDFWNAGSDYDYHPDLLKPDEESAEPKLGECSICMEPISTDQGDIGPERGTFLQLCWKQAAKKRRVYALAPCGHNFHTDCLEQWMDIKSICPQCRGPLPPM